jgi:polyhydroxyalkanoate synthase
VTRRGPRPLSVHLPLAFACWFSAGAKYGTGVPPEALERAARKRAGLFLDGIERYRAHPYRRDVEDPPALLGLGQMRLLDYRPAPGGMPVLAVPSLVNRAHVLDLSARRSLMRFLAARGFAPFLVDWGEPVPGSEERGFDVSAYVEHRLLPAAKSVEAETGRMPALLGYCMGGLLALAAARELAPPGLALLAAPWDFSAGGIGDLARAYAAGFSGFEPMGVLPVDALQLLFAALDPLLAARKFTGFAKLAPDSPEAEDFVALEDWLNDGVPLSLPVAREALEHWYLENRTSSGSWGVMGRPVIPEEIECPALVLTPQSDRIVPEASAAALAESLPNAKRQSPPLGHIGMVVSRKAPELVWEPLAAWLAGL